MDQLDEIRLRMRISKLEAQIELHEIDCAAWTREIDALSTTSERKNLLKIWRHKARGESASLTVELLTLLREYPKIRH